MSTRRGEEPARSIRCCEKPRGTRASDGVRIALVIRDMPLRLVKFIAVFLFVLGASPFTAPFATCDWRALTNQDHRDHAASQPPADGVLVKASTDSEHVPVLAAATAHTAPLFSVISTQAAVLRQRVSSQRILLQGLRV